MTAIARWRKNATANANRNTQPQGYGVRELRPLGRNPDAREAEEEGSAQSAEKEQGQGLAFSLSAPLALRSLPLLALTCKPIPRQAASSYLRTDVVESLCIGQLATVVHEVALCTVRAEILAAHVVVNAVV